MLGYDDRGEAVGLEIIEKLLEDIANKIRDSDADLLYHDVIGGNLFSQIETTLQAIQLKYLKARISYGDLYREERFRPPIPALREALLNVVVHKGYCSHNAIQISISPDKLMLWNPSQLPESWTLES